MRGAAGGPQATGGPSGPAGALRGASQPIVAGAIASIVGFAGSVTVVLAGLRAVGADDAQAASGLLALSLTMGLVAIVLGLRHRIPLAIAWSTPGAALLATSGVPDGGYRAALGAFAVCGVLLAVAGLWRPLARWIAAIPPALASAMLAGVLLPLCVAPAKAVADVPWVTAPVIAVWALLAVWARRWAVLGAVLTAVVAIAVSEPIGLAGAAPTLRADVPAFTAGAIVSLAIPLFIVTMASQNVTGMGVLASFGYRPPLRPVLVSTGAATVAGAPLGGHAINLAAITAALAAGPDADPDPSRRWIASVAGGATYLVLGLGAGVATAVVAAAPPLLVQAVAGLAMLAPLMGALAAALADEERREAALVTFVVSASGITAVSVSAPFWGLVAGLAFLGLQRAGLPARLPGRVTASAPAASE